VYIADTYKDCDLPLGRMPPDKQNCRCLDYSQNLVISLRGAQCQDGLTDWLTDRQTDRPSVAK
jgi:hypothetical protein